MVTEMDRAVRARSSSTACRRPGPTTASSARRAPTTPAPPACAGSSTPSTAPPTTSTATPGSPSRSASRSTAPRWPAWSHDPLHADVFTATLGGGAFRNGRPIVASAETDLSRALVATGFSYRPERRELQAAVLTRILPQVRDIRRMGAASVDLCSVAYGRADAYYERGLQPWDHVAGALIAREAGALVGHLDGGPEDVDFVLAAPPALYEPLRELLAEAGAADPWPISDEP